MSIAFAGFMTCLSLIVVIGAQNAFVLRQGIARRHVRPIVLICACSDVALIAAGIAGLGAVLNSRPWAVEVARYGGAAFLFAYGMLAARRAFKPTGLDSGGRVATTLGGALSSCFALTYLNPAVYLDTVVLMGTLAHQHGPRGRWLFGSGAALASTLWFHLLGFGARALSRWFERPASWRLLDATIAVMMTGYAAVLVLG
ncbi:MAG TPA: LysE/ArgO family amino acid transporter [Jiangellaceae bacterium]